MKLLDIRSQILNEGDKFDMTIKFASIKSIEYPKEEKN